MSGRERRLVDKRIDVSTDWAHDPRKQFDIVEDAIHDLVKNVFDDLRRDTDWVPVWENLSVQCRKNYINQCLTVAMIVETEDNKPWQRVVGDLLADANRARERREQAND